jgi:hypothetical protein
LRNKRRNLDSVILLKKVKAMKRLRARAVSGQKMKSSRLGKKNTKSKKITKRKRKNTKSRNIWKSHFLLKLSQL